MSDNGVTASSIVSKTDADKSRGVLIDFSVADSAPNGTPSYGRIVIFFDEEIADTGFGTLATAKGGLREIDDLSVLGTVLGTDGITYADRVITGAAGGQTVEGTNLSNIIKPGSGDDTVKGGGGDDILFASQGDDSYEGGAGYDIVTYAAITGAITIDMTDKDNSTIKDSFVDIEGIIGTRFDDVIVGATNAVLRLFGGAGNDKITAGSLGSRLYGDAGDDELNGGEGDDYLYGGEGSDRFYGGEGKDYFYGGTSGDTANYSEAKSAVTASLAAAGGSRGEAAGDKYDSIENLVGSAFDDVLIGDNGNNFIYGFGGSNILIGLGGSDTIIGANGIDEVNYEDSDAGVTVSLKTGAGQGGHAEGDIYWVVENITGSSHDDTLEGDDGVNVLKAGAGNDIVMAGGDGDVITLGAGDDVVDFTGITDFTDFSADIITDFTSGEDKLNLSDDILTSRIVSATIETRGGKEGLVLSASFAGAVTDFVFLEGVTNISVSDFGGDYVPLMIL